MHCEFVYPLAVNAIVALSLTLSLCKVSAVTAMEKWVLTCLLATQRLRANELTNAAVEIFIR